MKVGVAVSEVDVVERMGITGYFATELELEFLVADFCAIDGAPIECIQNRDEGDDYPVKVQLVTPTKYFVGWLEGCSLPYRSVEGGNA